MFEAHVFFVDFQLAPSKNPLETNSSDYRVCGGVKFLHMLSWNEQKTKNHIPSFPGFQGYCSSGNQPSLNLFQIDFFSNNQSFEQVVFL